MSGVANYSLHISIRTVNINGKPIIAFSKAVFIKAGVYFSLFIHLSFTCFDKLTFILLQYCIVSSRAGPTRDISGRLGPRSAAPSKN